MQKQSPNGRAIINAIFVPTNHWLEVCSAEARKNEDNQQACRALKKAMLTYIGYLTCTCYPYASWLVFPPL